jgi:thiamine biosynthesis lipoprotein
MRRVVLVLAMAVTVSCGNDAGQLELSGSTMGTTYTVKLPFPPKGLQKEPLRRDIRATVDGIEALASTYMVTSELSVFNASRSTDWQPVSAELCRAVAEALAISRKTEGAFDITVGPLVNLWGFGPGEIVLEPPPQASVDAARQRIGHAKLETDCLRPAMRKQRADLYLDLSGWAKGHAVDELAALLEGYELVDYLVEIGGELRLRGYNAERRKWGVAIEKPDETRRTVQAVMRITDIGVATSGDYRNFFEYEGKRYSHTIDPRTGRPVDHALAAVTVLHPSAAVADAMATALLVLGPESGLALAEKLGLAATFLVRVRDGAEQRSTAKFETMVAPQR